MAEAAPGPPQPAPPGEPAGATLVGAVDLGGTKLAAAVVDGQGRLLGRVERPTPVQEGPAGVLEAMARALEQACGQAGVPVARLAAVGVAAPGPLDARTGVVVQAPNLGWRHVDVAGPLQRRLGPPVFLENDANAAALGEWFAGAGRGTRHFAYLTISTGIGGGLVLDGQLFVGAHGAAGEVGHMVVVPDGGPLCGCGQRGCLEALASGTAIARRARQALQEAPPSEGSVLRELLRERAGGELERLDARLVGEAARRGDALALRVLHEAWQYLGAALVSLANLLDPEVIALGGGVSRLGELMLAPLREHLRRRAVPGPAEGTRLVLAQLGGDAGLVGAALVARRRALGQALQP